MGDVELFKSIGLTENKAKETLKNEGLTKALKELIEEAGVVGGCEKSIGVLIYNLATKPLASNKHRGLLLSYIVQKKITQLNFAPAFAYLEKLGDNEINVAEFEEQSGVGVVITPEQVEKATKELLEQRKEEILTKPQAVKGNLLRALREQLKFVEGSVLNDTFSTLYNQFLQDNDAGIKEKAQAESRKAPEKKKVVETLPESVRLPDPRENKQLTEELLQKHLEATGGRVVTRFPPEPNGFLHIGHAKSMNLNYGYAKKMNGWCYLRFDDTNPDAEKLIYINSIIDTVKWLGHEPYQITYSSDYFEQLYNFAVQLIKSDHAYVCHQTSEEMKHGREHCIESPYRNRPIETSLKLFEDMRKGKFKENEAVLRMKQDMKSPNPCMRDLVAYRIKYTPHPHVGDKWCIYPSYDFTHCIIDSLENITHSLCSLEFEPRRESYNWLLDALGIYRPPQIEFSRLNLAHTLMSKRRLVKLVEGNYVRAWDDPRLPTINGYRRKGYRPQALNNFCELVGVTRAPNTIKVDLLEHCCRQDLDVFCNRAMAVLNPLKVVLTNYDEIEQLNVPNHPTDKSRGHHSVEFSKVLYIEHSDFRLKDTKTFYGLAPGKEVGLRHAYNITCTDVIKDEGGRVIELRATVDKTKQRKPKGHIHWVAQPTPGVEPRTVEVRLYEHLFKSENPGELDNWLEDLNPNSLTVIPNAYVDSSIANAKVEDRYQFERLGFFVVDPDTTPEKPVWNRIVSLKDSFAKIQETD